MEECRIAYDGTDLSITVFSQRLIHPNGVTESVYRRLMRRKPDLRSLNWTPMRRDPEAYAKGRIRHPDHKTIRLRGWHRIHVNKEVSSEVIDFLD